jgi:hypothetical protein
MQDECKLAWDSASSSNFGLQGFVYTSGLFVAAAFLFAALLICAMYHKTRKEVGPHNWLMFTFALAISIPVGGFVAVTLSNIMRTLLVCV